MFSPSPFLHLFSRVFLNFIYLVLAGLGPHGCVWAFSSCSERKLLSIAVHRLLTAVAAPVAEHALKSMRASVAVVHRLICSTASGIFPDKDQTSVPCFKNPKADS